MTSLTKKAPYEYDFANYDCESDYEAIHRDLYFLKVSHVAAQIVSTPASEYGEGREGIVISTPYGIRGAWLDRPDDVILFLMGNFSGHRPSRYRSTPMPPLCQIVKYVDPGHIRRSCAMCTLTWLRSTISAATRPRVRRSLEAPPVGHDNRRDPTWIQNILSRWNCLSTVNRGYPTDEGVKRNMPNQLNRNSNMKTFICEQLWLHFYNRVLFEAGLITEQERNRMTNRINGRQKLALST